MADKSRGRAWALLIAVPLTLLVVPNTLTGLTAPVVLFTKLRPSYFLVSGFLFISAVSVASVLLCAWSWILTGDVPHIRNRRRRRVFFFLLCLGDAVLVYLGILLFVRSSWMGVFPLTGSAVFGFALSNHLRSVKGFKNV